MWHRRFKNRLRSVFFFWPVFFIAVATIGVILYGRGYRIDFRENQIKPTGLLSATSDPIGSQVFIENALKTATNNPLNLEPGWYAVKIVKEGYISWEKRLRVQGEVVTRTEAFLFPSNPSLSPVTNTGVEHPVLSPDGTKIAYTIPLGNDGVTSEKAGLWVYELVERPLGLNRDPRQLGISSATFDFSKSVFTWSPDSKQLLVDFGRITRLYNSERASDFQNITLRVADLLNEWSETKLLKERQQLAAFKQPIIDMATLSARIIALSPDESKILYEATAAATLPQVIVPPLIGTNPTEENRDIIPGKFYVYDSREDRNYFVLDRSELPASTISAALKPSPKTSLIGNLKLEIGNSGAQAPVYWFPTNRHLVLTLPGKIDIMEYDRTNWVTVYSGPFVDGFIAPWPNGSRIIIMTNLNPGQSSFSNLYTVNLR